MKKKVLAVIFIAMTLLVGCGSEKEEVQSPIIEVTPQPIATATPEPTAEPTATPEAEEVSGDIVTITEREVVDGKMQSYLTGEWKDAAIVQRRNIAVMVPNNKPAVPQYGISKASIIYEAPMESGTCTRLMPVFEDYDDLDRIGPVRSSRDYFVYEAMAMDSIYVNWGLAVPYVAPLMEEGRIDNISNAVSGQPNAYSAPFQRFNRGSGYSTEFTGYAVVDKIEEGISYMGYDTEYRDTFEKTFVFADAEKGKKATYDDCEDATKIIPGGGVKDSSGYQEAASYFEYNAEDGLYYRYQHGGKHIDEMNGEQLAVTNVVFKICHGEKRDQKGYLAFAVHGTGDAYVFTNGKVVKGTWERNSDAEPNIFKDENGEEIVLNQGKTWICNIWDEYEDCAKWE